MIALLDTTADPRPGIRVSASPVQPKDAIDFFAKKSPLEKADWLLLSASARKRAFTVAWVTCTHVLQSVKDSVTKAVSDGESFASWKDRIRSDLGERWSRSNGYLETAFRNNVQSAYAAGRYKAQTTPTILKLRPFWRLVVVFDGRTSTTCRPFVSPPVVLPADHPWWATHWPPLHHMCRSTPISMSRRQAERVGIMRKAPTASASAQDGWGSTAGLGEWQPTGESIDQNIFKLTQQAAAKVPKHGPAASTPDTKPTSPIRKAEPAATAPPQFRIGVHVKSVPLSKDEAKLANSVFALVDDPRLLAWLERSPLESLLFLPQTETGASGRFNYRYDELTLAHHRPTDQFGHLWAPGLTHSISAGERSRIESNAATLIHELGHRVHGSAKDDGADRIVQKAFRKSKRQITNYASVNDREYFAESFTAYYRRRADLRNHDPVGYKMVEDVLREREI